MSHGSFYHYFDSKEQIFREVAEAQEAVLTAPDDGDPPAPDATEFDRILRANRRYLDRYRANGRIMGVIEEVSRYDSLVNEARMRRQKHFAERAEGLGSPAAGTTGVADPDIDPEIAARGPRRDDRPVRRAVARGGLGRLRRSTTPPSR